MAQIEPDGWRSIPIQHQELDPDFQIIPQQSVSAYLEPPTASRLPRKPKSRTLDGDMLLDACNESFPGDVRHANLRSKDITGIAAEDAPFFVNLSSLELSDNAVLLQHAAPFPALRQLVLQCNGISEVTVSPGSFSRLERLDLSFNHLGVQSIAELAAMPNLRELDISSNSLESLPDMASFKMLSKLRVSGNRLHGDNLMHNLAMLPELTELSLGSNAVSSIGPLIRAGADAADAADTGGYCGPWATLQVLDLGHNRIASIGGLEVLMSLPALATLVLTGNPAVENRLARDEVYSLRQAYDSAGLNLVVGRVPLYSKPEPNVVSAYTAAADSMVTVSDAVKQNEYATNPDLWDILDSSDEEGGDNAAPFGDAARSEVLPAQYELDEDGQYKTPADMRAAYSQLR
jgi:hypothetical protein